MLFRELEQEDWKAIHTYASLESVSRYQPWGPNTEKETQEYVQALILSNRQEKQSKYAWAVLDEQGGHLIGVAEVTIIDEYNETGEIGYILHPDVWGQGYGTQVAKQLIHFGFEELKLHRIQATCHPANKSSVRVLEKCGMQWEGTIRDHLKMNEGWRDSLLYSVLET